METVHEAPERSGPGTEVALPAPAEASGGDFDLCLLDERASLVSTRSGFVTVPFLMDLPFGVVVKLVRYRE